jgi:hypothetical protein
MESIFFIGRCPHPPYELLSALPHLPYPSIFGAFANPTNETPHHQKYVIQKHGCQPICLGYWGAEVIMHGHFAPACTMPKCATPPLLQPAPGRPPPYFLLYALPY